MKKIALAIPILVLLASCYNYTLQDWWEDLPKDSARFTITNEGRFLICVNMTGCQPFSVAVGETAVKSIGFNDTAHIYVYAYYYGWRVGNGGLWEGWFDVVDGDDIELNIPDCPGWRYYTGISSIAYGNGVFAALGTDRILWSQDGTSGSWCAHMEGDKLLGASEIAFLNGRFVVLGYHDVFSSTDATLWLESWSCSHLDDNLWMHCIAYGNGRFVAGCNGYACWSTDCSTGSWSKPEEWIGATFDDIAFGNNQFVGVCTTVGVGGQTLFGRAACSPDGSKGSWAISCASSHPLYSITYGNGRFVAVGEGGTASWSVDGSPGSWSESKVCSGNLKGIAFGNGRFVAVGANGEIVCSPDGSTGTWMEASTGGSDLQAVTYGNGRFIAAGASVMSSPDGTPGSWTEIHLFE